MATIQDYLDLIKNAIYGKDVRQAIHNGIQQCYYDGKAGSTDLEARQRLDTAEESISSLGSRMSTAENDIDVLDSRVDEIVAPSGQAPSAAEVTDARVGADGQTYTSLGGAIRGQVSDLKSNLSLLANGIESINFDVIPNKGFDVSNGTFPDESGWSISDFIPVNGGETLHIDNPQARSDYNGWYKSDKTYITYFTIQQGTDMELEVPEDAGYVVITNRTPNYDYKVRRVVNGLATNDEINSLSEDLDSSVSNLKNVEANIYDADDTTQFYQGYYTSSLNGGTPGISDIWGIAVLKVPKGETIKISGCASNGGANSAWLNSDDPSDMNSVAWSTADNNGEHICVTDYLGLCSYSFSDVYKGIEIICNDSTSKYAKKLNSIQLVENVLTPDMVITGKYYLDPPTTGENESYRIIKPIRLLAGDKISVVYGSYAFCYFIPDGGTKQLMTTLDGAGELEYIAKQNGNAYITYTDNADGKQMVFVNSGLPANYVEPNNPISATFRPKKQYIVVASDGSGDFTNPIDAYDSIDYSSEDMPIEIYVKSGTYNFNDVISCPVVDTSEYYGINLTKPYVSIVGEDPTTTIFTFDGSPNGAQITDAQAMAISIFHLNFDKPFFGHIKNLTCRVKNGRYCVHPETAGKGKGNWLFENCIFDFLGNPNVTGWDGATVGIGISHGETGKFLNCRWASDPTEMGVVGHNNAYGYSSDVAVIPNAKLTFENCDFNGADFRIDNYQNDSPLHDMLYLINCANINEGSFGAQGGQTAKVWLCVNQGSEIAVNNFDE